MPVLLQHWGWWAHRPLGLDGTRPSMPWAPWAFWCWLEQELSANEAHKIAVTVLGVTQPAAVWAVRSHPVGACTIRHATTAA